MPDLPETPPGSPVLSPEEPTVELGSESAPSSEVTLPEDILGELQEIDDRFTDSAERAINTEYEKIGALQLLQRVTKDEIRDFINENGPAILLRKQPVVDDRGEVVAYDVYRVNLNAIIENPDEMDRINKLSDEYAARIRAEKQKLLDAAIQQGRATDLGEMSVSEWGGLPSEVLDSSARMHLYDDNGTRLDRVRVYQVHATKH